MNKHTPITHALLRARGFRIEYPEIDAEPRMVLWLDRNDDLALELCANVPTDSGQWFCWARSDISSRKCRFIHIRHLRHIEEVDALVEAMSGKPVKLEDFDAEQFECFLDEVRAKGRARWKEYCERGQTQDFIRRRL